MDAHIFKEGVMHNKFVVIILFVLSTLAITAQHNAKVLRDAVNPQPDIPVLTVNINQASADELAEVLIGVGIAKATEIVSYRKANGPFKSLQDLSAVKGIGSKTVEKNREKIKF